MTNLIFVQGCTPSALGLGVYMVVVTVVFSVFCLIGGAFAMAAAVGAKNDPMAPHLLTLFYIVMSLLSWLLTAFLIFTLFHPIGFSPTTTKGGPAEGGNPYIQLGLFNLIAIAITLAGLRMIIRNGEERRYGFILSLIGVGCLLFADVPAAALIANGCPLAIVVLGAITTTQQ